MTSSVTYSDTFTVAHARKLAGRVTTDLYQSQQIYGRPIPGTIPDYQTELEVLLAGHYVANYQFGFERGDDLVWSLRYSVGPDGGLVAGSHGGGVPQGLNVTGAAYFNHLTYSTAWYDLSQTDRHKIEAALPISRTTGVLPSASSGYWAQDRAYTAGGVVVHREVFRRTT